jgi:L-threonylcarbamoyladenylate synthase
MKVLPSYVFRLMSLRVLPCSEQALKQALQVLASGGVVAHATETCYGLACDVTNPKAVKKLFLVKKRPLDQPVSILFPSVDEAKKYVAWNDEAEKLAREFLPGPLTLILPVRLGASRLCIVPILNSQFSILNSVGVRISSHPLAMELVTRFGSPLSTTSANVHGLPNTYSADEIVEQFHEQSAQPDLVIDEGTLPRNKPSKIINLSHGEAKIMRI